MKDTEYLSDEDAKAFNDWWVENHGKHGLTIDAPEAALCRFAFAAGIKHKNPPKEE